uniref:Uncharacterized protein n=1 Tax=Setaria italica TaxID=4555 RepID=K3Y0L4_SETIT
MLWRGCLQIKDKQNLQSECKFCYFLLLKRKKNASPLPRNVTCKTGIAPGAKSTSTLVSDFIEQQKYSSVQRF